MKFKFTVAVLFSLFFLLTFPKTSLAEFDFNYINSLILIDDYKQEWKKVDSLISLGLPKSALEYVDIIYDRAKNEENAPNYIKAIVYKMKLQGSEENSEINVIKFLKNEIEITAFPVKPILESMLAEMYWTYYNANRYNILDRTRLEESGDDFQTWDLSRLSEEITKYYKLSLDDAEKFKEINISMFDDILTTEYNSGSISGRKYRPALYDLLLQRAITYFKNSEANIYKFSDKFILKDSIYFGTAEDFVKLNITSEDTNSFGYNIITLFQKAIKFHISDKNPEALINVDLERLYYVLENSYIVNKESLYFNALERLEKKYSDIPSFADIVLKKAERIYERSNVDYPEYPEDYKWDAKNAYDLCSVAIDKFPESDGAKNCKILQSRIVAKSLRLKTQSVNIPDKPSKILVSYKNIEKLYFKIFKTNTDEISKFKYTRDEYRDYQKKIKEITKYYLEKNPASQFSVSLPDDKDFRRYSTEVMIPPLPLGDYVIISSNSEKFDCEENAITFNIINISNISFINRKRGNDLEFYLMNRTTGEPLKSVQAQKYIIESGDYFGYERKISKGKTYETDEDGYFKVQSSSKSIEFYLDFFKENDFLSTNNLKDILYRGYDEGTFTLYGHEKEKDEDEKNDYVHFFTDRKIYRPGQVIYFKGIVFERDGIKANIVQNRAETVYLCDVNEKIIDSLNFVSNEYGTFSGKFNIPSSGLTGRYLIETNERHSYIRFSVEEYKRPKFEVYFDNVRGAYRLGDSITLNGFAISYSGAAVTGATVKYIITSMNISLKGTTITNDKGEFFIQIATSNERKKSNHDGTYLTYDIKADVTDINGETRSNNKYLSVGYKSMTIDVYMPFLVNKNKNPDFEIASRNFNGRFVPAEGKIKIYKLKNPDKILKERNWKKPDKYIYTKEEYQKYFPDEVYDDENNFQKWEKEFLVKEYDFNTARDSLLHLSDLSYWNQGMYKLEVSSIDSYGDKIENTTNFVLYSDGENSLPYPRTDWIYFMKQSGVPGENIPVMIGSSYSNVNILYEIEQDNKILHKEWLKVNNEKKSLNIPVLKQYQGNITIHFSFVYDNKIYTESKEIYVPFNDKILDISFETFRNKLQPGENEEWKLKIKGLNGEKVKSEMVAVLYDKSLDVLKSNGWYGDFYGYYNSKSEWKNKLSFYTTEPIILEGDYFNYYEFNKIYYDKLNWFGFNYDKYLSSRYIVDHIDESGTHGILNIVSKTSGVIQDESEQLINIRGGRSNENIIIVDGVESTNPMDGTSRAFVNSSLLVDIPERDKQELVNITARKNFNETAFFYPNLYSDENGEVTISFKIPEALTKWKMLGFAHTKDLKIGYINNELITQKDFMVVPNAPRFFREDDKISFTAKITNLSEKDLSGVVQLDLLDASTLKTIAYILKSDNAIQKFEIKKGTSSAVSWDLNIPGWIEAVQYKVVAKADKYSDGEEMIIPVLPNKILVTETMPLPILANETKHLTLDKLVNNISTTLTNYK